MGFGITELIIVMVIVILLFGTKKLSSLGSDLGGALKGFRSAMKETEELNQSGFRHTDKEKDNSIIEGESAAEDQVTKK